MFKTVQPSLIKCLSGVLKDILIESNIYFKEDGIHLNDVDITEQIFVELFLKSKEFEMYSSFPNPVCFNIVEFHKSFGSIHKQDILHVALKDTYVYQSLENPIQKRTCKIETISVIEKTMIPSMNWSDTISIPCGIFHKIIRELTKQDTFIEITVSPNKIIFQSSVTQIERTVPCNFFYHDKFLSSHLVKLSRASHLNEEDIQIQFKQNYPMILEYTVGHLGKLKIGVKPL